MNYNDCIMKNSLNFESFHNPYFLVPINPIFDELSFGIKFIINSISEYSGTPLSKYFFRLCTRTRTRGVGTRTRTHTRIGSCTR